MYVKICKKNNTDSQFKGLIFLTFLTLNKEQTTIELLF